MASKKIIRLRLIVDDDDPWVEYPLGIGLKCGVLKKNPRRGEFIYVPGEDNHAALEAPLEELGYVPRYTQHWVPKFRAWLRGTQWPDALLWDGGEWPVGSVWRDYKGDL